jgi:hypothetical protein
VIATRTSSLVFLLAPALSSNTARPSASRTTKALAALAPQPLLSRHPRSATPRPRSTPRQRRLTSARMVSFTTRMVYETSTDFVYPYLDHTGVLVCQYGFCQTDRYCKKGTKCHDKCSCCRNMDVLERDIGDVDTTKVSLQSEDIFISLPSITSSPIVPATTYGSCKQTQAGVQSCRENNSMIVVCDIADYMWRSVGKCPGGDGCCEARPDNANAVQCKC